MMIDLFWNQSKQDWKQTTVPLQQQNVLSYPSVIIVWADICIYLSLVLWSQHNKCFDHLSCRDNSWCLLMIRNKTTTGSWNTSLMIIGKPVFSNVFSRLEHQPHVSDFTFYSKYIFFPCQGHLSFPSASCNKYIWFPFLCRLNQSTLSQSLQNWQDQWVGAH